MNTGIGVSSPIGIRATALTKFKTDLPPAIQYLTGITITPQNLVLQTALSNTMGNSMLRMAQSLQDSAFVAQYARQWAENERRTTYQTMGRIAEEKLPLLRALIEAFLYAIFPIIVLTALILPTAVPFTYVPRCSGSICGRPLRHSQFLHFLLLAGRPHGIEQPLRQRV